MLVFQGEGWEGRYFWDRISEEQNNQNGLTLFGVLARLGNLARRGGGKNGAGEPAKKKQRAANSRSLPLACTLPQVLRQNQFLLLQRADGSHAGVGGDGCR